MPQIIEAIEHAEEPRIHLADGHVNIGALERLVSVAAGAALVATGIYRRSWLGAGLAGTGAGLMHRGLSGHCMVYQAVGINRADGHNSAIGVHAQAGAKYEHCLHILRSPADIFQFWRKLENLPSVMTHLKSVTQTGSKRSHWVARGPMEYPLEWDAELINERENELIAWRSMPDSEIDTAGSVRFEPGPAGNGTYVHVSLKYDPPGGQLTTALSDFFGIGLEDVLENDLERLKQVLEAGEIPNVEGQPTGQCCGWRP